MSWWYIYYTVFWYWFQLAQVVIFHMIISYLAFGGLSSKVPFHPILRFPTFLMGIYAGILCLRNPATDGRLPWPSASPLLRLLPYYKIKHSTSVSHELHLPLPVSQQAESAKEESWWRFMADRQALTLLALSLLSSAGETAWRWLHDVDGSLYCALWLQALLPFAQLEVAVALTRDGSTSLFSRLLRTRVAVFLGKISAALYLIHVPTMGYVGWVYLRKPAPPYPLIPWFIAVHLIAAIVAATILFYGVEEPIRKWLRKPSTTPGDDKKAPLPPPPALTPSCSDDSTGSVELVAVTSADARLADSAQYKSQQLGG